MDLSVSLVRNGFFLVPLWGQDTEIIAHIALKQGTWIWKNREIEKQNARERWNRLD